ncbi:MAG: DUF5057 domain-containing protein [Lachnospiraceae bacterium]|nr:DUF5057 domain-containing protein [Lachnospiraceae bacterium]
MKKQWKALAGFIACLAVVVSLVATFMMVKPKEDQNKSATALPNVNKDDFVILEIVPDESYAQLGYLNAGSEPDNFFENIKAGKGDKIAAVAGDGVELVTEFTKDEYDALIADYGEANVNSCIEPNTATGSAAKYVVKDGGTFPVNKNYLRTLLDEQVGVDYEKDATFYVDNIVVETVTVDVLNDAEKKDLNTFLNKVDFIVVSQTYVNEAAQRELSGVSTETATFLTKDADWDTVKAIFTKVGNKKNPTPIVMDSSIYTNAISTSGTKVSTKQYKLNREVKYSGSSYSVNGDLFKKTDFDAGTNKAASNNFMYKLYLMSMFRDPADFYNCFVESGLINDSGKYQLQSDDAKEYWSTYTFLPAQGEINTSENTAGNEEFWRKQKGIFTQKQNDNAINCNVLSWDFSKQTFAQAGSKKDKLTYFDNLEGADSSKKAYDAVQQIFAYEPKACIDGRTYKVLELQPAKGYSLSEAYIERLLPYTSYTDTTSGAETLKLEIVSMTTAEFIGKIETLTSVYDMIYIGKNTDGLPKNDAGEVYYGMNNDELKGKIYTHVGAKVNFGYGSATVTSSSNKTNSNGYALFKNGESGKLRYSGNDITKVKKAELEQYLKTGLPIVVEDGLIADAKKDVPDYFGDPAYNNMRAFLKTNEADLLSLDFNYHSATKEKAEEVLSRLTKAKPVLTISQVSIKTTGVDIKNKFDSTDLKGNVVYKFYKTDDDRNIKFTYNVVDIDNPGIRYMLRFYVDSNADGRFVNSEKVGSKAFVANGSDYTFNFSMNTNYSGPFTWKLEVYPVNNPGLISSQIGYGTIRFKDETSKRTVRVLQVEAVKGNNNNGNYDKHATNWGYEKAQQVDLTSETFQNYLSVTAEDFDIKITKIDLQEFCYGADGSYGNASKNYRGGGRWTDENFSDSNMTRARLTEYDMIIFGFADSYRDMEFNQEGIAADVQDFISLGKSVLFTHDLTSQINNESILGEAEANAANTRMETTNGRGFNKWLRDAMGLNRFNQDVRVNKYLTYTPNSQNYDSSSTSEKYGFTYTALMQYSNFTRAWTGGTTSGAKTREKGFYGPYENLYVSLWTTKKESKDPNVNDAWPAIGEDSATATAYASTRVTNVNDGQITKYPYDLSSVGASEKFTGADGRTQYKIATTHGQYYQLNMEAGDVVCWYALSDQNSSGNGWYSSSPNDVVNNYYIYNKGNVTYTGVGHSTLGEMSDFEKKLFVNTIVAALRAGVQGPQPHITNGYNIPEGDENRQVIYSDVDVDSREEDFAKKEKVEFYLTDDSTTDSELYVTLEVQKTVDGSYDYKDEYMNQFVVKDSAGKVVDKELEKYTRTVSGSTKTYIVWKLKRSNDTTQFDYTLEYPKDVLKNKSYENFKIIAYNSKAARGYENGAVMRRTVFKLD